MTGREQTIVACVSAICLMLTITITANVLSRASKAPEIDFIETCAWGGSADSRRICSEIAARFAKTIRDEWSKP